MPVDPVGHLETTMRRNGAQPELIASVGQALRSNIIWKAAGTLSEPGIQVWEATVGEWLVKLFAYPLVARDHSQTGVNGYSFSMVRPGLVLLSDSPDWAAVAEWLNHRRINQEFLGSGRVPTASDIRSIIAHHKLKMGNLDLREPEQLKLAVNWVRDLIAARDTDPCGWCVPRTGAEYGIWKAEKRIRIMKGQLDMPTRICFYALGYTVENDEVTEHDAMMCRLWASLYTI